MPRRNIILANDEIYHVFNKGVAGLPIFKSRYDYQRLINLIDFYRFSKPPLSYSHFKRLPTEEKKKSKTMLYKRGELVSIYAFTLMPNHYHLQIRQLKDDGITKFVGNLQNAYARYFNTKYGGLGSLFQLRFKAVRVENDEQCLHINRYIHLNPLTSYLLKEFDELYDYPWSSFSAYISKIKYDFVNTEFIMDMFNRSKNDFIKFTKNQLDYQRELAAYKHLTLE